MGKTVLKQSGILMIYILLRTLNVYERLFAGEFADNNGYRSRSFFFHVITTSYATTFKYCVFVCVSQSVFVI